MQAPCHPPAGEAVYGQLGCRRERRADVRRLCIPALNVSVLPRWQAHWDSAADEAQHAMHSILQHPFITSAWRWSTEIRASGTRPW